MKTSLQHICFTAGAVVVLVLLMPAQEGRAGTNVYPGTTIASSATLRLTGLVYLNGKARAFMVKEERGQAPEYLSRDEGVPGATLALRAVDAERGEAHVVWNGQEMLLSFTSQETAERTARAAEQRFVDKHTRAHEELQRREKDRLAREQAENANRL